MKKLIVFGLAFALCVTACSKKAEKASSTPSSKTETASPVAIEDNKAKLAKLLEGVELTSKGLKSLYDGKKYSEVDELDFLLLGHDNEEVRTFVYNRSIRNYSSNSDELQKFVAYLKGEKNAEALEAGLKSLSNNLKVSPDLYEFAKTCAKSDDTSVRAMAAYALSNVNNKSVSGIYDEAIKLINDPENDVRKVVCEELPRSGNEAVVPELVKILKSTDDKDVAIHGECLNGLVSMWYNWPIFDNYSEAAYNATLDYFKTTPRTKKIPAWTGMSKLGNNYKEEWKTTATFVNLDDIVAVMADVAKDDNADSMVRRSAVKAIGVFGTKADLESLNAAMGDSKDSANVKKEIESAIAKK